MQTFVPRREYGLPLSTRPLRLWVEAEAPHAEARRASESPPVETSARRGTDLRATRGGSRRSARQLRPSRPSPAARFHRGRLGLADDFAALRLAHTAGERRSSRAARALDLGHDADRLGLQVGHGLHVAPRAACRRGSVRPSRRCPGCSGPSRNPSRRACAGRHRSRHAPTRITSSFVWPSPLSSSRTSNSAGVKQGRCSPTSLPLRNTRVP